MIETQAVLGAAHAKSQILSSKMVIGLKLSNHGRSKSSIAIHVDDLKIGHLFSHFDLVFNEVEQCFKFSRQDPFHEDIEVKDTTERSHSRSILHVTEADEVVTNP